LIFLIGGGAEQTSSHAKIDSSRHSAGRQITMLTSKAASRGGWRIATDRHNYATG